MAGSKSPVRLSRQEDLQDKRGRASLILDRLRTEFAERRTALSHGDALQLLVATILSAQCTDERVNMVTPGLFAKYPDAKAFAAAPLRSLEKEIRSTGFFRMKAKHISGCCKALLEHQGGVVPSTLEELVRLPGVGRKTANVVLAHAFNIASGVVVDTHVFRLSRRLGLSAQKTPEKVERDLMEVFPQPDWIDVGNLLIFHGRKTCNARTPACVSCSLADRCPSAENAPVKKKPVPGRR